MIKWATNNEPCPWNLFLYVNAPHILAVGIAGACKTSRVTMVDANNFFWVRKFNLQEIFWIELEVDG